MGYNYYNMGFNMGFLYWFTVIAIQIFYILFIGWWKGREESRNNGITDKIEIRKEVSKYRNIYLDYTIKSILLTAVLMIILSVWIAIIIGLLR